MTSTTPATTPRSARIPALAGIAGGIAAIATSELMAGLFPGAPSLVLAVGALIIELQPPGAKDFVVALFGTNDKLALEVGVVVVALAIAAGLGVLATRRFGLAAAGFAGFATFGFVAAVRDTSTTPVLAALTAAIAAAVGIQVLSWLVGPARAGARTVAPDGDLAGRAMPDWSRRGFLLRSGSVAAVAAALGVGGRSLLERQRMPDVGLPVDLPVPGDRATLPDGADLDVPGITPIVIDNDSFYRIDTALLTPRVDVASWRLRIHGMVEREVVLDFEELTALPAIEQYVTIACVSNEVGGNLVGNAKWGGVRLRDVLALAGVQEGATQLVGRSVDGWTAGMPTAWVMDPAREPMIAVSMNDEPLPGPHGFPARLIVPGLYGYVSATKWLKELQLTTLEAFDAYWIPLGWAKEAPILTQSRIDTPRPGASIAAGIIPLAGVAWAPDRGISRVEVAIDGEWREATLSVPISDATWVQWRYDWDAQPGTYEVTVRATDGAGEVQTDRRTRPAPDGARGHHAVTLQVG